jgi:hypothetical protein
VRPGYRWEDNIRTDIRYRLGRYVLAASGPRYGPVVGSCVYGNEHVSSLKVWKFFD